MNFELMRSVGTHRNREKYQTPKQPVYEDGETRKARIKGTKRCYACNRRYLIEDMENTSDRAAICKECFVIREERIRFHQERIEREES